MRDIRRQRAPSLLEWRFGQREGGRVSKVASVKGSMRKRIFQQNVCLIKSCIYTELLSNLLYNLPLIHPFRCWSDCNEQFLGSVSCPRTLSHVEGIEPSTTAVSGRRTLPSEPQQHIIQISPHVKVKLKPKALKALSLIGVS